MIQSIQKLFHYLTRITWLDEHTSGRDNNYNLIRLIAAMAVLFGHSYALSPRPGIRDPMTLLFPGTWSGALAVDTFFLISGLLVCASVVRSSSIRRYFKARILRLMPALLVCLILSVFVLGPSMTTLPAGEYFSAAKTWGFLFDNALLVKPNYWLPGVFENHPNNAVNGSLWTLPAEARLYLLLGIAGLLWITRRQWTANLALAILTLIALFLPDSLPLVSDNPKYFRLAAFFATGVFFFINRKIIPLNLTVLAVLLVATILTRSFEYGHIVRGLSLCYLIICFAYLPKLGWPKWMGDYSYGLYIYAFPCQQLAWAAVPDTLPIQNSLLALSFCLPLAVCSWHFIEKPALALKEKPFMTRYSSGEPFFRKKGKKILPPRELTDFLCHFSFWFGLAFATPLFIALHNIDGIALQPGTVASYAALASILLSFLSWLAVKPFSPRARTLLACFFLSLAFLTAIQGNWIHDLHRFGVFDGRPVDFRANPAIFWLSWLGWLTLGAGLFWLISRITRIPAWLPALPVLSFCLLLLPSLLNPPQAGLEVVDDDEVDPSVYAFSSLSNLIHLLPDGFQGDTVRQALEEDPGLASRFEGFTLFTDHLGRYPGTAPSLYSMLTGKPFPLERGFDFSWVGPETRRLSYQTELARAGFQVDLVPISNYICPENASSCHPRPFKNHGFSHQRDSTLSHSLLLLVDLTLFRLSPLYLKEKIYDRGYWLLSDIATDGDSPKPDPILREWTENLHVVADRPVYKWYHYIGTHVPPHWDASCDLKRHLEPTRKNYLAQAHCILNGIAGFIDRLKAEGIYEQTAFIVSGDHGHNTVPDDQVSPQANYGMYDPLLGNGRPTLLIKARGSNGPLAFSDKPTQLLNIMPTALELAGLPNAGESVFEVPDKAAQKRLFHHYPSDRFWSGHPVPYLEYAVGQPANDAGLWSIADMVAYGPAPREYVPVNKKTAKGLVYGARLRSSIGHRGSSVVRGRQLAFIIDVPEQARGGTMELELSLPPGMESQLFTVQLNGGSAWSSPPLQVTLEPGDWFAIAVPLDREYLKPGTNFVSVMFKNLQEQAGSEGTWSAANIKAIRVSQP